MPLGVLKSGAITFSPALPLRKAEAIEADSSDLKELEQVQKQLSKKGGRDAS